MLFCLSLCIKVQMALKPIQNSDFSLYRFINMMAIDGVEINPDFSFLL